MSDLQSTHAANSPSLPRYDPRQSYDWNYRHAPDVSAVDAVPVPGRWQFCGLPVDSPLGIAAGPLLNGRWVLYYASLGFDVLTYKTVRSSDRPCYPLPNLQPVRCGSLYGHEAAVTTSEQMLGSWAVSFGMPSQSPDVWRADVAETRRRLPRNKLLSVSVVGTVQPGWSVDDLARDYARCAQWAVESGADAIETNFSCPNVSTCDGQLFQNVTSAAVVAQAVRGAIGRTPYIVKIGHLVDVPLATDLLRALAPHVDALAMTNSVATQVIDESGQPLFAGERRGICGDATRDASLEQTRLFSRLIAELGLPLATIGVGGVRSAEHVRQYLAAGAHAVHLATAAMTDPNIGLEIRRLLADDGSKSS